MRLLSVFSQKCRLLIRIPRKPRVQKRLWHGENQIIPLLASPFLSAHAAVLLFQSAWEGCAARKERERPRFGMSARCRRSARRPQPKVVSLLIQVRENRFGADGKIPQHPLRQETSGKAPAAERTMFPSRTFRMSRGMIKDLFEKEEIRARIYPHSTRPACAGNSAHHSAIEKDTRRGRRPALCSSSMVLCRKSLASDTYRTRRIVLQDG